MMTADSPSGGHSFAAVTPDGATLRAWSLGDGPRTLLLVSGLGGSGGFWKDAAQALAPEMRVLRFDQRGIGASTLGTAQVTIEQLARDCLAVLDAAGAERAVVLGHSTGGCICQSLARIAPQRMEAMVLSATWLQPSRYIKALFETRRAILETLPSAYAASSALLSYPPQWLEENWHVFEAAVANAPVSPEAVSIVRDRIDALLGFDGFEYVQSLDLPALVLGADDDMIIPGFLQAQLAAALPSAQLTMLQSGGHFFPITRRNAFVEAVSQWAAAQ